MPVMIPHPVVGIAILSLAGRTHPFGRFLSGMGIEIMGTRTGIVAVLVFVGIPFYVNAVKVGFESVPVRLEYASRTLGAGTFETFRRVTLPLMAAYGVRHHHVYGKGNFRLRRRGDRGVSPYDSACHDL